MARKRSSESDVPPNLVVAKAEAVKQIASRIESGCAIRDVPINDVDDFERARVEQSKWDAYNRELLLRFFDNSALADEYTWTSVSAGFRSSEGRGSILDSEPLRCRLPQEIPAFRTHMGYMVAHLEALRERLELIPERLPGGTAASPYVSLQGRREVFVVHGHDGGAKETVARFLEKLGLKAIILHEQPNVGRTIIEKFEHYADVGFAVVLLTPDDEGRAMGQPEAARPRARQNVIFELGCFFGRLGRERVCALYKERVELPSDIQGILYVPMDADGAWRLTLAREIKQAGIDLDLNKAL